MVAAYLSPDEILVYNKELDNYRCIVMGLFLHYFFMAQFSWMMTQVEHFILVKNVMDPGTMGLGHQGNKGTISVEENKRY